MTYQIDFIVHLWTRDIAAFATEAELIMSRVYHVISCEIRPTIPVHGTGASGPTGVWTISVELPF